MLAVNSPKDGILLNKVWQLEDICYLLPNINKRDAEKHGFLFYFYSNSGRFFESSVTSAFICARPRMIDENCQVASFSSSLKIGEINILTLEP